MVTTAQPADEMLDLQVGDSVSIVDAEGTVCKTSTVIDRRYIPVIPGQPGREEPTTLVRLADLSWCDLTDGRVRDSDLRVRPA